MDNSTGAATPRKLDFENFKNKFRGRWRELASDAGIDTSLLTGRHSPCPLCGGRDRFRFDNRNGDGTWFCNQCGAGDGLKLIKIYSNLSYADLFERYTEESWLAMVPQKIEQSPVIELPDNHRAEVLNWLWNEARPVQESDPVGLYLRQRNFLERDFPSELRYHPELKYVSGHDQSLFPGMLARVISGGNELVNLHRTYLTADGSKAPVSEPKKLMKPTRPGATCGAAIRLYPAGGELAIAEGIETALAVFQALRVPTWSVLNAGNLKFVEVPEVVKRVYIAADNDEVGIAKAKLCAIRLTAIGKRCKLLIPEKSGCDWADVLDHEIAEVLNREEH